MQHITSTPYHPATNGLAERFVQTWRYALKTSQGQGTLHQRLHNFLLNYRNTPHATTKTSPANLMLKRDLRTTFDLLKLTVVKDIVQGQQEKQIKHREQHAKDQTFTPGETVLARNYSGEPKWVPANSTSLLHRSDKGQCLATTRRSTSADSTSVIRAVLWGFFRCACQHTNFPFHTGATFCCPRDNCSCSG